MANFYIYDISFLVIFTLFIVWFLYTRRKNLKREGILYLYRTQFGIKAIDYVAKKYKKSLNVLQYISIICGFMLMILILVLFFQITYIYVSSPEIVKSVKVPPVIPLIPYLPEIFNIDFLPPFYFTYWILILAIIAISHEFAHGIFAKFHNIKIKSTGFGFLGPFLAAFVEPDEKQMNKKSIKAQLSVLCAGTFANIIMSIIFTIVLVLFFLLLFVPSGVIFNSYGYSAVNISQIQTINGNVLDNPNIENIIINLNKTNENNLTKIQVNNKSYLINNQAFLANVKNIQEIVFVYEDLPAVNAGLNGAITEINNIQIRNQDDLSNELSKYKPGNTIVIKTKLEKETREYNITLAESGDGRAIIGVSFLQPNNGLIKSLLYGFISQIRNPNVYYENRIGSDLSDFIYDLLWWMIFLNISVALVNMLPLGLFDGGRVFYLTILHFTKSKDASEKAFKYVTWFLLLLLGIIMVFWAFSFI
ncbi:MAG TPA: site-2 protease family protein [Candidatus Nanoarchaeia archaeon]|nr:site-2 protease family protein [Candidatus Nanoarchaeia archaeon]